MNCPACRKEMASINNDTGMGVSIISFYCRKCDVSYTDKESVEVVLARLKSANKPWVVSQLRIKGCAA